MNKQQLASKIWESANKMRSKIEASEYKDYILGFIFYKYLSDKALQFVKQEGGTEDDYKNFSDEDFETIEHFKNNIGYFIAYKNLFSTWIKMGKEFDVSNVRDALSRFSLMISPNHKKLFEGVFDTLQTGLSKLGENAASQTRGISDLLFLIKDIPMDGKQNYDVLGFIYEYLISMFAANAGKKAGEFYTPHEVSLLMSEIVANHLKNHKQIQIYDPTSGSGSLLINIGRCVAKHIQDENNIKYYAQESIQNTYNLTRMNLVMRGILPNNITTRCGDTLKDDWPYFEENNKLETYNPLYVDAVVSNPPYSQKWDPKNKESDPRYARFGLAPKTKADYAFLLHDLYHLKPDGIMTIVLPHGVLFRGNDEGLIRKKLIEENHIDAIIGLPANVFFGTGIPTIIMVLKQKRDNTDVLMIDASKGFIKVGKNNLLRASDIKKITDTVIGRLNIPKYSKVVSRDEIRGNDYNLNIPRYIDSTDNTETWDIYATMFGGIPEKEIDELKEFWQAFPDLRNALFQQKSGPYAQLKINEIKQFLTEHKDVKAFKNSFSSSFGDFHVFLKTELIDHMTELNLAKEETILANDIFQRLKNIPIIDKYEAYQLLDDDWLKIAVDLEIIQTEGFAATKKVDPILVIKKKDEEDHEVQEGWKGRILPFELVQENYFKEELQSLKQKEACLIEIESSYEEMIDSFTEEEKGTEILNEANDAFVKAEVSKKLKEIYADVDTEEIKILKDYLTLLDHNAKKPEKDSYVISHPQTPWNKIAPNKDGSFSKNALNKCITELQEAFVFEEDSFEYKLSKANALFSEEKELKEQVKAEALALHLKTKKAIENFTDQQVYELLELKWINPLVDSLNKLPEAVILSLSAKIQALSEKYSVTYESVVNEIHDTEKTLSLLIDELDGSEFDMQGMAEFKALLKGE